MIIAVPKETKFKENRVAVVPAVAKDLVAKGKTMKPFKMFSDPSTGNIVGLCNSCNNEVLSSHNYCPICGQALDWSDEK